MVICVNIVSRLSQTQKKMIVVVSPLIVYLVVEALSLLIILELAKW